MRIKFNDLWPVFIFLALMQLMWAAIHIRSDHPGLATLDVLFAIMWGLIVYRSLRK
jgi:hypothetical protein